jgi:hypothetical protein
VIRARRRWRWQLSFVLSAGPVSGTWSQKLTDERPLAAARLQVRDDSGMFFDLGVYGVPLPCKLKQRYDPVTPMRAMEQFIRDVGGYSFLYADTFMDEEELWQMFDRTLCAFLPP